LVNFCSRPPSPVSVSPSPRARSTSIAINCSSVAELLSPATGSCSTIGSVVIVAHLLKIEVRRYLYTPGRYKGYWQQQLSYEAGVASGPQAAFASAASMAWCKAALLMVTVPSGAAESWCRPARM
jgi:hypothetical protein